VRPGVVGITDKLSGELRPERKGNGSPTMSKGKLARFLQPGCTTSRGGALRLHGEASEGLR
jgi:hypothetical protein